MTIEQRFAKLVKFFKTDYAFQSVVEQVEELTHRHMADVEERLVEFICDYDLEEQGAEELSPDEQRKLILGSFFFSKYLSLYDPVEEFMDNWRIILNIVSGYVELKSK